MRANYQDTEWDGDAPLTRSLTELRDGIAPPAPNQGAARARRLEQMQADIAACTDFVADCDRYADDLAQHPTTCLTPLVPKLMKKYLWELRVHAVDTANRLHDELAVLRQS